MKTLSLPRHKSGENFLATVTGVKNGVAKTLRCQGVVMPVVRQADHIPYLTEDDEVLCCYVSQGAYVLARSLSSHAKPILNITDDKLNLGYEKSIISLGAEGDIRLHNPMVSVLLSASGGLHSYAKNIKHSTARAAITLSDCGRIDFTVPE